MTYLEGVEGINIETGGILVVSLRPTSDAVNGTDKAKTGGDVEMVSQRVNPSGMNEIFERDENSKVES